MFNMGSAYQNKVKVEVDDCPWLDVDKRGVSLTHFKDVKLEMANAALTWTAASSQINTPLTFNSISLVCGFNCQTV